VYSGEYSCDGCHELGDGWVYHCDTCKFDLHISCVEASKKVSIFAKKFPYFTDFERRRRNAVESEKKRRESIERRNIEDVSRSNDDEDSEQLRKKLEDDDAFWRAVMSLLEEAGDYSIGDASSKKLLQVRLENSGLLASRQVLTTDFKSILDALEKSMLTSVTQLNNNQPPRLDQSVPQLQRICRLEKAIQVLSIRKVEEQRIVCTTSRSLT